MTWEEIHEVEDLGSITAELTEDQSLWLAIASQLDIMTAIVLLSDLKLDKILEANIDKRSVLAEKLEEIFEKPTHLEGLLICKLLRHINDTEHN